MVATEDGRWQRERLVLLGRLATSVAHEINGCLAALALHLGEAETLASDARQGSKPSGRGEPWSRLCERIEGANECATRIADLVDELRRFGRPDAPAPELVQLDDVARAALRLAGPLVARVARSELALGHPAAVRGHQGKLVQVAVNLLRNAADALGQRTRPHEGNRVVLGTRTEGKLAILGVEDNGPGIPPELLARLPVPYLSTKPGDAGTGLGLAICDEIVRAHGGELRIQSTPGSGTRVEMRLPVTSD